MFSSTKNIKALTTLGLASALLLSGCAQDPAGDAADQDGQAQAQADALAVTDSWAKAAQSGMSAAFANLENTSDQRVELESVTDKNHGATMEIHEMYGEGTAMVMQQIEGPLAIEAGSQVALAPGGNHIMYMDLDTPLVPAEVSTLTLNFSDGSSKDVEFAIRNYDGANESYHGEEAAEDHDGHGGRGH